MHNFIFRRIVRFRQNYWFWPSMMTFGAVILGFVLPYLDSRLGLGWIEGVGFIRAIQVDGARAILTTLAGATLGAAGVAFSVTIVAVSFASSNYGPRLIGNFMGDRTNQIVLGVFVATFVYCITVLSTVHARLELSETTIEPFVPQISVFFALLLTLAAVGALIGYIHHIPESINIMNLTAKIGDKLRRSVILMLNEEDWRGREERDAADVDVEAWRTKPQNEITATVCAKAAGFLQQIDLESLAALAGEKRMQIILHRAPGDFLVAGEIIMSARPVGNGDGSIARRMRDYTRRVLTERMFRTFFSCPISLSKFLGGPCLPESMTLTRPCSASIGCAPVLLNLHVDLRRNRRRATIRFSIGASSSKTC